MAKRDAAWTLGELAQILGGECMGEASLVIRRPAQSDSSDPEALTFAESAKFLKLALESAVGAVLITEEMSPIEKPSIVVKNPRHAFGIFLHLCHQPLPFEVGIHPTAVVHPEAAIDPQAAVGPYVVIERRATVGAHCRIHAHTYVGENCQLGEGVTLHPHVVLVQDVFVDSGSTIHAGTVVGADGFGYYFDGAVQQKIPQVGGVRLGKNVELGALVAIDRATAGHTTIAEGTKIDNLVQVAHNARIGSQTVIASQTGIAGSAKIGNRVSIGGQAALSPGSIVGDDITLGARTGVTKPVTKPGAYWETPAMPYAEALKSVVIKRNLPELMERLKALEMEVAKLKGEKPN